METIVCQRLKGIYNSRHCFIYHLFVYLFIFSVFETCFHCVALGPVLELAL